jgi:putative RNA 2'-phosphotransferase
MDNAGWVAIDELIERSKAGGKNFTREILEEIVASDAKGRYSISDDRQRIRANQGHSINVDLGFKQAIPPVRLFHGTHEGVVATIMKKGLDKMKRHHVHLSADYDKAVEVGARRGKPVVLEIDAAQMVNDKIQFFVTENGVWLTDGVPVTYLKVVNK